MSHLTKLKMEILKKDILIQSIKEMGYDYVEGTEAKMDSSWGWKIDADILLTKDGKKVPIGFKWKNDRYEIEKDFYGTGLNGNEFSNDLFLTYNKLVAIDFMNDIGYSYDIIETEDELLVVGQDWS